MSCIVTVHVAYTCASVKLWVTICCTLITVSVEKADLYECQVCFVCNAQLPCNLLDRNTVDTSMISNWIVLAILVACES